MSALAEIDRANSESYDLGDAAFKARAREYLADWARRKPFYVFNNGPTQVIVGRYADVHEVFSDADRFSSEIPKTKGYEQYDKFMGAGAFLTQIDGEQHARLRRLMIPAFGARRMAQVQATIGEIIDGFLNEIDAGPREFDAMNQYAARLVVGALLATMLGLDEEQQAACTHYQTVPPLTTAVKPGDAYPQVCLDARERMMKVATDVIEDRRAVPKADFITDLVNARDNGDKLSDDELLAQVFGLFGAIASTPRSGSGAIHMLAGHRDQLAQINANPALLPDAIEECLRIAGNGYFTFARIAMRDTEVGGTPILKGMIVRPSPQAANYDPTVYADPLRFDIHRKPKRIMTFGAGPHHCIGNLLGRMTLTLAIGKLFARFPNARLADPDFVPEYGGANGELRMKTLPMVKN